MVNKIIEKYKEEFGFLIGKFNIISLTIKEAYETKEFSVASPGVYIFWNNNSIIKVGRHLVNSRKRALQHISDNTKNEIFEMANLANNVENCGLVLINCKEIKDKHWVAAIEIYLEENLEPIIKSQRTG